MERKMYENSICELDMMEIHYVGGGIGKNDAKTAALISGAAYCCTSCLLMTSLFGYSGGIVFGVLGGIVFGVLGGIGFGGGLVLVYECNYYYQGLKIHKHKE